MATINSKSWEQAAWYTPPPKKQGIIAPQYNSATNALVQAVAAEQMIQDEKLDVIIAESKKRYVRRKSAGFGQELQPPLPPPVTEEQLEKAFVDGSLAKYYFTEAAAEPPAGTISATLDTGYPPGLEVQLTPKKKVPIPGLEPEPEDGRLIMNIETTKLSKIVKYVPLPEAALDVGDAYNEYTSYLTSRKASIPRCRIPEIVGRNREVLVGLELELEGMETNTTYPSLNSGTSAEWLQKQFKRVWNVTKDDSLRDSGAEWVSKVGLQAQDVGKALALLKLHLEAYYSNMKLNYRCGTHVHVNVRDFTVEQLINMTMLYILFEDLFYKVSGERYKNIFCVPIRASTANVEQLFKLATVSKPTYQDFRDVFKHFTKYMAFNLLPAGRANGGHHVLGTVEFRHHKGESDPAVLTTWVQYILDIHQAAQDYSFKQLRDTIFNLNTASNYVAFARSVFSQPIPVKSEQLALDMYDGSGHIKELYIQAKGL